jgi:hypothetical protein
MISLLKLAVSGQTNLSTPPLFTPKPEEAREGKPGTLRVTVVTLAEYSMKKESATEIRVVVQEIWSRVEGQ